MKAWNKRAFAAIALALGAASLSLNVSSAGETNDHGFMSWTHSQPQPIRRLIDWLRGLTMPAGIVKAEGRIDATRVDVSSKYAGEIVDVAAEEGDKVAKGQVIARLSSPQLEAQLKAAQADLRSAQEARAQDAIKAAEAKVKQINSMIGELTLVAPRDGKVQRRLAHAGDSVLAGAPIVTLIDLDDVYMTVFLDAADAGKLVIGDEARLILDGAPDYVVPATVGFVASAASSAPKTESKDALAKLTLRADLKIDPQVLHTYYRKVETGLSGAGFVRTRPKAKWPADLQVKLPPAPVEPTPPPVAAPVTQESAPQSAPEQEASVQSPPPAVAATPAPAPVAEATPPKPSAHAAPSEAPTSAPNSAPAAPARAAPPATASAPAPAAASKSAPVAREAKAAPPPPPVPAPPTPPAAFAAERPEPAAEVAPQSLAQIAGAWTQSAADCKRIFQRRGGALTYRQPVDKFAQAVIIDSQSIRVPTGVCRLQRASHEGGALKISGECQDTISYTSQSAYLRLRSKNEIVYNPAGDRVLDTLMIRCAL